MVRKRWSLDLIEWPEPEQQAWTRAVTRRRLFQGRALAAGWSRATRAKVIQAQGQWLHFLLRHDWLRPDESLCGRVTEERLGAYVHELETRIESVSAAGQLRDLGEGLRVMDPEGDRTVVLEAASYAHANAKPSRDERHKLVAPSDFFDAALDRMRRFAPGLGHNVEDTLGYEGGLMMAVEVCKPMRRLSCVALRVPQDLFKNADGNYALKISEGKTELSAQADAVLPVEITPFIDSWLDKGRPLLLKGSNSAALWLTASGNAMTGRTFYYRFCHATGDEFDSAINPHFLRKIVATGVSTFTPELVEIIHHVLDHTSDDMRKEYYDLAERLAFSCRYAQLLSARRERALNNVLGKKPTRRS